MAVMHDGVLCKDPKADVHKSPDDMVMSLQAMQHKERAKVVRALQVGLSFVTDAACNGWHITRLRTRVRIAHASWPLAVAAGGSCFTRDTPPTVASCRVCNQVVAPYSSNYRTLDYS